MKRRAEDGFEDLLARCVELAEDGGTKAVRELLVRHPEHASELAEALGKLVQAGLVTLESGSLPRQLGAFRPLRALGAGAMGEVYLAEQLPLGREVALKVVRGGPLASEAGRARLEREARALAALDHPHVVGVHAFGREHGLWYMAMDYVPGEGLDDVLERRAAELSSVELTTVLEWCAQVASALGAAHEVGLVHRDVKPSNVRITPEGRAVLIDFGLVRDGTDSRLSMTGAFLGTPQYCAPEQAAVERGAIGPATDVFALGVVLYEAATGHLPFDGEDAREIFLQLLTRRPLERLGRGVPRGLRTVIGKALEKDPRDRYADGAALEADLRAVLEERPVNARRSTTVTRAVRWSRRHPVRTIACLTVGLAAGGLAASTPWSGVPDSAGRRLAGRIEGFAVASISPDGQRLSHLTPANDLAVTDFRSGRTREALAAQWANQARPSNMWPGDSVWAPDGEAIAVQLFIEEAGAVVVLGPDGSRRTVFESPAGSCHPCCWTSDGRRLVVAAEVPGGYELLEVGVQSGEARTLLQVAEPPVFASLSPCDRFLAFDALPDSATVNRDVYVHSLASGETVRVTDHPRHDYGPVWALSGRWLAFASNRTGSVDLWAVPLAEGRIAGEPVVLHYSLGPAVPLGVDGSGTFTFALLAGGKRLTLATLGADGLVGPRAPLRTEQRGGNHSPQWAPSGRRIAYLSARGLPGQVGRRSVVVQDVETGEERFLTHEFAEVKIGINMRVVWEPGEEAVRVNAWDRHDRRRDLRYDLAAESVELLPVEAPLMVTSARLPEGDWLIVERQEGADDRLVRVVPGRGTALEVDAPLARIAVVAPTPAGDAAYLGGPDGLWLLPLDGRAPTRVSARAAAYRELEVLDDELLVGLDTEAAVLLDRATGERVRRLRLGAWFADFDPVTRRLVLQEVDEIPVQEIWVLPEILALLR